MDSAVRSKLVQMSRTISIAKPMLLMVLDLMLTGYDNKDWA